MGVNVCGMMKMITGKESRCFTVIIQKKKKIGDTGNLGNSSGKHGQTHTYCHTHTHKHTCTVSHIASLQTNWSQWNMERGYTRTAKHTHRMHWNWLTVIGLWWSVQCTLCWIGTPPTVRTKKKQTRFTLAYAATSANETSVCVCAAWCPPIGTQLFTPLDRRTTVSREKWNSASEVPTSLFGWHIHHRSKYQSQWHLLIICHFFSRIKPPLPTCSSPTTISRTPLSTPESILSKPNAY